MYPSFEHIITQGLRYIGDGGHVVIFVRERDEVPTSGDRNWDENIRVQSRGLCT